MRMNYWLILGTMLSTSLLAQQATNPAPAAPIETPAAAPVATLAPAPAKTNAPAAKSGKKKSGKKKSAGVAQAKAEKKPEKKTEKKAVAKKMQAAPELKSVPLMPGLASVVASNVNVRGQAKLKSEVVTHLTKGQSVTVLEEILHSNSGPEEPSAWAKILLPPGGHAWVNTMFIDATNKTVRPKKLNLRSGPGENYSVIALMQHGDAVKELNTKGDWTEIEPPATAYAFVAAQYLKQGAEAPVVAAAPKTPAASAPPVTPVTPPAPAPAPAPVEPPPAPTTVATGPAVAPPPTAAPVTPPPIVTPVAPPPIVTPATPVLVEPPVVTPPVSAAATEPAVPQEPPPPRIVQREGIVRGMTSIQAPSRYVLRSVENGRDVDYLYSPSKELDLSRWKGLRVIVTGEEGLDDRWGNTPIITIQKIQTVGD